MQIPQIPGPLKTAEILDPSRLSKAYADLGRTPTGKSLIAAAAQRGIAVSENFLRPVHGEGASGPILMLAAHLAIETTGRQRVVKRLIQQLMRELGEDPDCPCVIDIRAEKPPVSRTRGLMQLLGFIRPAA